MKSVAILALIAGTASAFTTSNVASTPKTALQASAMDDMVGAVDLRGKEFKFDPVRNFLCYVMTRNNASSESREE